MKKNSGLLNLSKKKWTALCGIIPLILLMSGCFCVEVKNDVKNPNKYFREAYHKMESLHKMYPERMGPVSTVHVLVYEKSEKQLIRVIAPMWIIDEGMDFADTYDVETDCDFEFHKIKKIRDLGPGMLMEADGEDSKVLVWLE